MIITSSANSTAFSCVTSLHCLSESPFDPKPIRYTVFGFCWECLLQSFTQCQILRFHPSYDVHPPWKHVLLLIWQGPILQVILLESWNLVLFRSKECDEFRLFTNHFEHISGQRANVICFRCTITAFAVSFSRYGFAEYCIRWRSQRLRKWKVKEIDTSRNTRRWEEYNCMSHLQFTFESNLLSSFLLILQMIKRYLLAL